MVHIEEANAVGLVEGEALVAVINSGIAILAAHKVLVDANPVEFIILGQ